VNDYGKSSSGGGTDKSESKKSESSEGKTAEKSSEKPAEKSEKPKKAAAKEK
jgi:hypothetical protein